MVGPLLAAVVLAGAPAADIASAARRLAPADAKVVLAEERSWDRGVVAWVTGERSTAVPLGWRAGRWRAAPSHGVAIAPTRARVVGRQVRLTVRVTMRQPLVDDAMWLDGRSAQATFFPGPIRGETATFSAKLRPGRHVLIAYAAIRGAAVARAWTLTVR